MFKYLTVSFLYILSFILLMELRLEKIKNHLKEVATIKKSPHSIAGGFAIGTFLALLPTFGFGIIIGLLILLLSKKISKLSMLIAFAIWNPLVLAAIYPVSYIVGNAILSDTIIENESSILNQLLSGSESFLLGSFILALAAAIVSYLFVFSLSHHYKKIRARRKQKKLNS